jgi:hypothetical protein
MIEFADMFALRVLFILLLSGACLLAQPRSVEIWGNVGGARVGGDEGSDGGGVIYGAGISAPLSRRIAVEFDVARVKVDRFGESTHTLFSPALVWRWGTERVYGFAGGGFGLESTSFVGFLNAKETNYNAAVQGRGGVVFSPNNHFLFRLEAFTSFQYALPTAGVKAGVGYRF